MITNQVLAALRSRGHRLLREEPERIHLARDQVLCRRDLFPDFVYFPAGAVISHTITLPEGTVAHVGLTGWEGVVGYPALPFPRPCVADATVTMPGGAWRLRAETLGRHSETDDRIRSILEGYAQLRLTDATINAACVALHSVEERLCGMLLALADRVGDRLPATHRLLGFMVGARRSTITRILDQLTREGLVGRQHRTVAVLDRSGLLSRSCRCYARAAAYLGTWMEDLKRR